MIRRFLVLGLLVVGFWLLTQEVAYAGTCGEVTYDTAGQATGAGCGRWARTWMQVVAGGVATVVLAAGGAAGAVAVTNPTVKGAVAAVEAIIELGQGIGRPLPSRQPRSEWPAPRRRTPWARPRRYPFERNQRRVPPSEGKPLRGRGRPSKGRDGAPRLPEPRKKGRAARLELTDETGKAIKDNKKAAESVLNKNTEQVQPDTPVMDTPDSSAGEPLIAIALTSGTALYFAGRFGWDAIQSVVRWISRP